ncbi:MAG: hypothetical protein IJ607_07870 [Bacteroidaceae bacterium]|nr:hypothetical protein [Bacteroidaceae bacterium]
MKFLISIILLSLTSVCASAQTDSLMVEKHDSLRNDTTLLPNCYADNDSTRNDSVPDDFYAVKDLDTDDYDPVIYELPTVLDSIFHFRQSLGQLPDSVKSSAYLKYNVNVLKRNLTMFFVPKVDVLISGTRRTLGESINKVTFYEGDKTDSKVLLNSYTLSRSGARNVPSLINYLTPYIYNRTIFKSYIFSPFHRTNRSLYRYKLKMLGSWAELSFKPKIKNPQLIKGKALINPANGQVLTTTFKCDFRMYKLQFNIQMNDGTEPLADPNGEAVAALLPKRCNIEAYMRFLWNKIDIKYENTYEPDINLPDTISNTRDRKAMSQLRPYPLTEEEEELYQKYDSLQQKQRQEAQEMAGKKKKLTMKRIWNDYGKQLFRTHTAELGNADLRLNPLIDPMQLLHSSTKGFIYRIKTRAVVRLGENAALTFAPNGAYNFRRKRCYYELPLSWEFNTQKNAHIQMNMYNTDPISNTGIKYEVKKVKDKDAIEFDSLNLEYYHNMRLVFDFQYSFRPWNQFNVGANFYRRSPMHKGYINKEGNIEKTNFTFAPFVEWTQRLWEKGPTLNINYEQGIMNVMGSTNSYGKQETDITWKLPLKKLRTVSLRLGGGCYIFNNRNRFLDFNKFRDNNLQDTWNDKWTSDFQLIDRRWYNASDFYIRNNVTYESPLMLASWLPVVGRHVRMERVYVNNLVVEDFHPYTELGYGFATKAFSFAAYTSFMNGKYNSIGCRFSLEFYTSHY